MGECIEFVSVKLFLTNQTIYFFCNKHGFIETFREMKHSLYKLD